MSRLKRAQVANAERQALMARSSSVEPLDERFHGIGRRRRRRCLRLERDTQEDGQYDAHGRRV